MSYAERFLVLVFCALTIITWAALDDDMGVRVFNAGDGKTLCEVKLKDYVESGDFSCNFDGKDADVTHGGTDQIEMELFSYKNNVAFKQKVGKIHQIRHLDESLHLGHYKEFYVEDEKMGYVQKVLVTSGAAFILNSALHQILDGFIWNWLGLPFFTVVMPKLKGFFQYLLFSINPLNLFKRKRRFGFLRPHLSGKPKPPHSHTKPHGPHKPDYKPQAPFGLGEGGGVSVVPDSKSGVNRKRILHAVKWGILSWLVVLVASPLSISSMRDHYSKWTPGSIPTSTPRQQSQKYFSAANKKTKNKISEKRNVDNRRGQKGAAASGSTKGKGNILQNLFFRWKHSSLSNRISQELFNGKKPPPGSPICPLRHVVVDTK